MRSTLRVCIAVALAAVAGLGVARSAAAAPPSGYVDLWNVQQGKCLAVRGGAEGAPVVGTACRPEYIDQHWRFMSIGGSSVYHVRNRNSQKCIVARKTGSQAHKAVQTGCAAYQDQYWYVNVTPNGGWQLKNQHSDLCLILQSPRELTQAYQGTCNASYADQRWVAFNRP